MDIYAQTLAAHNWSMYDITDSLRREQIWTWDELAQRGPAPEVVMGSTYILAPNPNEGETLRATIVRREGLTGPHVRIPDINSPDFAGLRLTFSPHFAFFTRIAMRAANVKLYSPTPPQLPFTDEVYLDHANAAEVFARHFGVMSVAQTEEEYLKWRNPPFL